MNSGYENNYDNKIDLSKFKQKIHDEYDDICVNSPRKKCVTFELNKSKNRYFNISTFEDTRVKLHQGSSDYINANYIEKAIGENIKYIATQGPLQRTCYDFWQMVWDNDCEVIVMLCKLTENCKQKCYKYWPTKQESVMKAQPVSRGLLIERLKKEKINEFLTIRTFNVKKFLDKTSETSEENRIVHQIQLLGWPDFGVPDVNISLNLIDVYNQYLSNRKLNGHVITHCSAGVGRTGTFIAINMCIEQFSKDRSKCSVKDVVEYIRTKRPKMVQTAEQYEHIYYVLVKYFMNKKLDISVGDGGDCSDNINSLFSIIYKTVI